MKIYRLEVRQVALDEAAEISAWYDKQSAGLGERFLAALDDCFAELIRSPLLRHMSRRSHPTYGP